MNLPASVATLGEQLGRGDEIVPDPALFDSAETFAAEREAVFARPWDAVDHASRLDHNEAFFRCDTAGRSLLVTRDGEGGLHALRNLCLHAGYPICEAEEGAGPRLICPYHGWEYTLDGRLVEPNLSARIDPARLQVARHAVCLRDGLILVGRTAAAEQTEPPQYRVPDWLADARVAGRSRCGTSWNWKYVLQFVDTPHLFLDEVGDGVDRYRFGPLSLMFAGEDRAVMLRVIPKFAGQTDLQRIELAAPGTAHKPAATADAMVAALASADGTAPPANLDRDFYGWYWSLMSP